MLMRARCLVVVVAVFTLNRSFYPTSAAVPPVSLPDSSHERYQVQILWSQDSETEKNQTLKDKVGKV